MLRPDARRMPLGPAVRITDTFRRDSCGQSLGARVPLYRRESYKRTNGVLEPAKRSGGKGCLPREEPNA
jgi:hypothetical protein